VTSREKLTHIREEMASRGLHIYLVPSTDPHQSEYVPTCWQRRVWASGFTGSVGDLIVTRDAAFQFADGRYHLQVDAELRGSDVTPRKVGLPGVLDHDDHLRSILEPDMLVGVDPRVISHRRRGALEAVAASRGASLVLVDENLVDLAWDDQPPLPVTPVELHPTSRAGESRANRLKRLRKEMAAHDADAVVVAALDQIAWLLNLRGADVVYNPLSIAYLVVTRDDATLFVNPAKLTPAVTRELGKVTAFRDYEEVVDAARALGDLGRRVWADPSSVSAWLVSALEGARLVDHPSPLPRMKARKNAVEMDGMRAAHVRDGVALTRFLHWLAENVPGRKETELSAARRLLAFREEAEGFRGPSFATISGYGPHGAIIHYRVSEESDAPLRPKGIYLIDSGGHYVDGTTDVTRTVLLGSRATKAQRDAFTRVLKGMIALSVAVFPEGTRGLRLDTLARQFLWATGLDYRHGTGHGVGSYMNVHEGPQSIGVRCSGAALEVGNVQSNEPGYYADGEWGVRIENLIMVVPDEARSRNGTPFFGFETLTLAPIDTRLIEVSLLTEAERAWLNAYHRRVKAILSPHLDRGPRRYLADAAKPI
jgi:Xaa-Pro aminopeptidase